MQSRCELIPDGKFSSRGKNMDPKERNKFSTFLRSVGERKKKKRKVKKRKKKKGATYLTVTIYIQIHFYLDEP
jgi:hypothetical protein